jgi:hypothetical protein
MKHVLGFATVLLSLGLSSAGEAKPIKVWLYGDGESTRMYSEYSKLSGLPSDLTVVSGAENSSGPEGLADKVRLGFLNNLNSLPDVVHIGYAASASTYFNCALHPTDWSSSYASVALQEATAIRDAAAVVVSYGKRVLLTKGTGSPTSQNSPPPSPPSDISPCMNAAVAAVTWDLAVLAGECPWVDYSGKTADPRVTTSSVDTALVLDQTKSYSVGPPVTGLWQADRVHVSCDKANFLPGDPYSVANCRTVSTTAQRANLGAWRVAKTVLKAYKYFQL